MSSGIRLQVLQHLSITNVKSVSEIAIPGGLSNKAVQTTLNHLVKEGYVTKISGEFGNVYALNGDLRVSDLTELGVELVLARTEDVSDDGYSPCTDWCGCSTCGGCED